MGKRFYAIAVAVFLVYHVNAATVEGDSPCNRAQFTEEQFDCEQTEYEAYLKCVHARNEIPRQKREIDCPLNETTIATSSNQSLTANCQRLNFECRFACYENATCEAECPICPINADLVADDFKTVVIEGDDGKVETFQARIEAGRNVTTIIKLTNLINNTNTINIPTNVTTSNVNNIHLHNNKTATSNETGGEFGLGTSENGSCCLAVRPKTCYASSTGVRCQHKRHKTCGPQCKARVIHVQSRQKCKSGKCDQKVAYVPEPGKPRCTYTDYWPYVACGGTRHHRKKSCDGCYDHYGRGYDNYYDEDEPDCRGCYDDAFDVGPLYRRGPVLRPFYYHEPPCFLLGTCVLYPAFDCGYGCFGDEFIDPVWGRPDEPDEYDDDEQNNATNSDKPQNNTANNNTGDEGDWAIEIHKCKVVSDDGTIEIKNCTSSDIGDNPYAASPKIQITDDADEDDDVDDDDDGVDEDGDENGTDARHRRHIVHPNEMIPRRRPHRKQYLQSNYIDDDDVEEDEDVDDRVNQESRYFKKNGIVEDEEYEEVINPYARQPAAKRQKQRKQKTKQRKPKYVYDYEEDDY